MEPLSLRRSMGAALHRLLAAGRSQSTDGGKAQTWS
jgi:hypothetical protein